MLIILNNIIRLAEHFEYVIFPQFRQIKISFLFAAQFVLTDISRHTLGQKCRNTELFLVRIFLYSVLIQENTDQK